MRYRRFTGLARQTLLSAAVLLSAACTDDPAGPNARVAHIEKFSDVPQRFPVRSNIRLSPAVLVTDAQGEPVRGARVAFNNEDAYRDGVSDVTVTTGADGIARAPGWEPLYVGPNRLDATVGSLAPVIFTTTGYCVASGTLVLPSLVTGRLDENDCAMESANCPSICSPNYHERFSFTLAGERTVRVEIAAGDDAIFEATLHDAADRTLSEARSYRGVGWPFFWVRLPAGSYELEIRNLFGPGPDYTLSVGLSGEDLGCNVSYLTRNVATTQRLDGGDCTRRTSDRYDDQFLLMLPDGESATVTMASTGFAPLLQIEEVVNRDETERISIASTEGTPGTPASLMRTCHTFNQGCLFRISATSAAPSATGGYSLSVR